jgi:glycosyltransferase involved in cell wall biosynthesis
MPPAAPNPRLTVVVLTWNEAANVGACLDALREQTCKDFEVVLLDAASRDGTVEVARAHAKDFPVPLTLEVAPRRTSVGEARNRGVELARAPAVGFVSADAVPSPQWVEEALAGLEEADLVYGRQEHAPHARLSLAGAVRGLRYHFPSEAPPDPAAYASHVSAAIRKDVLASFPLGTTVAASALDDLLLARRAERAGRRVAYRPGMAVRHRDVRGAGAELRKNWREGLGWGAFARELGWHRDALLWLAFIGGALMVFAGAPGVLTGLVLAGALWAPAVRRAWRRRRALPRDQLALGVLATPPFDLAFLAAYLRGLAAPERAPFPIRTPMEDAP